MFLLQGQVRERNRIIMRENIKGNVLLKKIKRDNRIN